MLPSAVTGGGAAGGGRRAPQWLLFLEGGPLPEGRASRRDKSSPGSGLGVLRRVD